jgi:hypothetical protein
MAERLYVFYGKCVGEARDGCRPNRLLGGKAASKLSKILQSAISHRRGCVPFIPAHMPRHRTNGQLDTRTHHFQKVHHATRCCKPALKTNADGTKCISLSPDQILIAHDQDLKLRYRNLFVLPPFVTALPNPTAGMSHSRFSWDQKLLAPGFLLIQAKPPHTDPCQHSFSSHRHY